jgi:hypothetical protein
VRLQHRKVKARSAAVLAVCNPPCPPKTLKSRLARECRPGTVDAPQAVMIDLLLVLATAAFFAFSWGYARICERL